jgi:hypothetical protein
MKAAHRALAPLAALGDRLYRFDIIYPEMKLGQAETWINAE